MLYCLYSLPACHQQLVCFYSFALLLFYSFTLLLFYFFTFNKQACQLVKLGKFKHAA